MDKDGVRRGWGVQVAVGVAMPMGVPIHIDFRAHMSMRVTLAVIAAANGAAGTPAVPDVVTLGAVMDKHKEAQCH